MTWLGKILSVFALILAIASMWFISTAFVARTNWKKDRDAWQNLYKEAEAARVAELSNYKTEKDSLIKQIAAEQSRSKGLTEQITTIKGANEKIVEENKSLTKIVNESDVKGSESQAVQQALTDEVKKTRDRNVILENQAVTLVTAKENAERDRQTAENLAKQALSDKLIAEAKVETLAAQNAELQAAGGNPNSRMLNSFKKPAAPLPDGIRGTVTGYRDGYVSLSIGIDAGLTNGAVLDIFRLSADGSGEYLGTVTVDRAYPKEAVATFREKTGRALGKLRPEQLPKAGDIVGKVGVSGPLSIK